MTKVPRVMHSPLSSISYSWRILRIDTDCFLPSTYLRIRYYRRNVTPLVWFEATASPNSTPRSGQTIQVGASRSS
ncbi:protein of unknown function [Methylorubrum extorquens DM4]|uniref:Uncharacterized protein n=1 Tax=Methylorubrum extorquens (strain DSM 6343 / CIP 106787 / DM4) TaxID=661410 RepID=C7CBB6_METED|nr:protein of unknown function [Methylorubrum extorquens DM4]